MDWTGWLLACLQGKLQGAAATALGTGAAAAVVCNSWPLPGPRHPANSLGVVAAIWWLKMQQYQGRVGP